MTSQFGFLQPEFPEIFAHVSKAESVAQSDPRTACFYARLALEVAVKWLYAHDGSLRHPYETTLSALIHEPTFRNLVGQPLVAKARIIKDIGNTAVHETRPVAHATAAAALRELFHFSYWLTRTYARRQRPDPSLTFAPEALPRTAQIPAATLKQLQEIARRFAESTKAREDAEQKRLVSETERTRLEQEIAQLRAEIAATKKANEAAPDTHNYNEAETRDAFVDLLLHEAGWSLNRPEDREYRVTGMPTPKGEGFVDYVLWGDDGRPLGLVEAKRTRRDARVGQQQAKLYADCLEKEFGQRPVIFYTNGYEHWIWDDVRYAPRPSQGFLKKDELQLAIQRRALRKSLTTEQTDGGIVERYYQERAIRRIAEAFERDNLRKALLVMATGSGKTRTVIALCDLLMRANWVKRALFLADRVALVRQSVNAFKRFLPSASPVNLVTDREAQGRVYVSTYPTIMRLIDETHDGTRRFGVGHFDVVIIDEAHRSVYRKYGAIFDYFDSFLVGLTATPKDEVDRDTYRLFDLQRGVPTDAYSLDEAVQDGYLVPPRAVTVPLKFQREGITYDDLSEEEKEQWDALEWDEEGNIPERVEAGAVNKWLFNADTVDKVLEHLMTHGLKVADGDRLGKTIIFAKNREHAHFIVQRFDASYPHLKGSFARVIEHQTQFAQSLIDDFSQAEKAPHIAISVDMLDTGIDVPEIANLVFFKIVRSKTKFWQMLGRGTRLSPNLFGPGNHKEFFYVFDFCQNFEFFNQNPKTVEAKAADPLSKRLFTSRVELIDAIDKANVRQDERHEALRRDTAVRLQAEVAGMNVDNFIVRPKRRYVEKYADPGAWEGLDLTAKTELVEQVAGLPTSLVDSDLEAKQFDLLMLRAQLALLRQQKTFEGLKKRIVEIAGLLEELQNIPIVAAELPLILEIQTPDYWQDIQVPMLETVRRRLRELVKLIQVDKRSPLYSDFEDEIGAATVAEVTGMPVGTDMARFRAKARLFLKEHENHVAVFKLRRNDPLTRTDLEELERMFVEAGVGSPEEIELVSKEGGFGLFVRSLVGLDRAAAKQALDGFIQGRTLTANQHEFLNMVVEQLTSHGVMDPRLLYEPPFTDLAPLGVEGLFTSADVHELVRVLRHVQERTAA